tara:strand:- start:419 stop:1795 length:1377 start_codon:yes stop_codon:yes gene_type:complete
MSWQSILKSYDLDDFIIVKEKKKKVTEKKKKTKDTIKLPNGDEAEVDYVSEFENVVDALEDWKQKVEDVSIDDLRMTGRGAKQNLSVQNLFEVIDEHVTQKAKRDGVGDYGPGVKDIIEEIKKAVESKNLLDEKNLQNLSDYTANLKKVGRPKSKVNPQNIVFTVPDTVGKDGATSWKKVYGHYRTPEYIKHRKAKGKKETITTPAKDSWYNKEMGVAKPPMWQVLFGKNAGETEDIPGINKGLLPLLEEFEDIIGVPGPIAVLKDYEIKGAFERKAIEKSPSFMKALTEVLSDQSSYRDATGSKPFDRLWINYAAVKRALQIKPIDVIDEKDSDFILELQGLKELKDNYEIDSFRITNISLRLIRTILKNIEDNPVIATDNFLDTHPHGTNLKGIFLEKPINRLNDRKELWDDEIKRLKGENKEIPPWARPPDMPPESGSDEKKMLKSHWTDYLRRY